MSVATLHSQALSAGAGHPAASLRGAGLGSVGPAGGLLTGDAARIVSDLCPDARGLSVAQHTLRVLCHLCGDGDGDGGARRHPDQP